jgi:hypothetical protein
MATTETDARSEWASSRDELRQAALHRVHGYAGRYVIRFVDLEALIANDALPERLMAIALREVLGSNEDARKLAEQIRAGELDEAKQVVKDLVELQRHLTVESIVAPQITLEDVESGLIDPRDFELLRQIAMRERNTDAKGVFLGVVPLDVFTTFLELHELAGGDSWAEGHPAGLVEACPACQAFERALSTAGRL